MDNELIRPDNTDQNTEKLEGTPILPGEAERLEALRDEVFESSNYDAYHELAEWYDPIRLKYGTDANRYLAHHIASVGTIELNGLQFTDFLGDESVERKLLELRDKYKPDQTDESQPHVD